MNSDGFLFLYPVFLIGKYSRDECELDPGLQQKYAVTDADGNPAYVMFTDRHLAEVLLKFERFVGKVVDVHSPVVLAGVLCHRPAHVTHLLIDANPRTGRATGFDVEWVLRTLEKQIRSP